MAGSAAILLACLVLPSAESPADSPDVVVVSPESLQAELQPWIQYRREQGHVLRILPPDRPEAVQRQIRQTFHDGRGGFVVLVGDVPAQGAEPTQGVPTWYVPAELTRRWGSEPLIATDVPYGDLDGDGVPELAVGRLPASSGEELQRIVAKTLAYERQTDFGRWRRTINVVASNGGFGPLVDGAIERVSKQLLANRIPPGYQANLTYTHWSSPYCPDLSALRQHTLASLGQPALAWIYLGHGRPDRLEALAPGQQRAIPILDRSDADLLPAQSPRPVAVCMACYTSAIDAPTDCLAERLLQAPGGPVAVIGGTRVTMPYGMAVLGMELLHEWFHERSERLGPLLTRAKRRMTLADQGPRPSRWLDAIAWPLHPQRDSLDRERLEHVQLFQLLGDPLLRLRHPQTIDVQMAEMVTAGEPFTVAGQSPIAGRATVELVCAPDRFTFQPPVRSEPPLTAEQRLEMTRLSQRANDRRWTQWSLPLQAGEFATAGLVPREASGDAFLRIFVEGEADYALGWAAVKIQSPASDPRDVESPQRTSQAAPGG